MHSSSEIIPIQNGLQAFAILNLLITIIFNIGWIFYCIRECWRVAIKYRTCKKTPNLHPIYRDVQYLSRQRKLYNLKTHFVKFVLIVMCLSVEVCGIIWLTTFVVLNSEKFSTKMKNELKHVQSEYPHCDLNHHVARLVVFPFYIFMYAFTYFQYFLLFVLLSILTRYLAARYLNHSFKRTFLKYISWLAVQFVVVLLCSTIYTILFSLLLFPLFILINWIVLLRDNIILSRVLRSNLREIERHSNNKVLYREQLSAYRFYRIFQKTLLLSLFFLVIVVTLGNFFFLLQFLLSSMCIVDIFYGIGPIIPNFIHVPPLATLIPLYEETIGDLFTVLYSLSTSLPLVCVTFFPLIQACVKRYKSRHNVYRFNYENIKQPLLK